MLWTLSGSIMNNIYTKGFFSKCWEGFVHSWCPVTALCLSCQKGFELCHLWTQLHRWDNTVKNTIPTCDPLQLWWSSSRAGECLFKWTIFWCRSQGLGLGTWTHVGDTAEPAPYKTGQERRNSSLWNENQVNQSIHWKTCAHTNHMTLFTEFLLLAIMSQLSLPHIFSSLALLFILLLNKDSSDQRDKTWGG